MENPLTFARFLFVFTGFWTARATAAEFPRGDSEVIDTAQDVARPKWWNHIGHSWKWNGCIQPNSLWLWLGHQLLAWLRKFLKHSRNSSPAKPNFKHDCLYMPWRFVHYGYGIFWVKDRVIYQKMKWQTSVTVAESLLAAAYTARVWPPQWSPWNCCPFPKSKF